MDTVDIDERATTPQTEAFRGQCGAAFRLADRKPMVPALIMRSRRLKEKSWLCGGGMSVAKNCSDQSTRFVIEY